MKYILEFGVRGGPCCDNIKLDSLALGQKLAANLVRVFGGTEASSKVEGWRLAPDIPRLSWQSSSNYVSLSRLDGMMRGSASAKLWRKGT